MLGEARNRKGKRSPVSVLARILLLLNRWGVRPWGFGPPSHWLSGTIRARGLQLGCGREVLIGVKYCGGCNPSYDRTEAVEALAREIRFKAVRYDNPGIVALLVVCGCPTSCPLEKDERGTSCPTFVMRGEEDVAEARNWLAALVRGP